jgi:hypothetical protein
MIAFSRCSLAIVPPPAARASEISSIGSRISGVSSIEGLGIPHQTVYRDFSGKKDTEPLETRRWVDPYCFAQGAWLLGMEMSSVGLLATREIRVAKRNGSLKVGPLWPQYPSKTTIAF